jgi:hypothetical protein
LVFVLGAGQPVRDEFQNTYGGEAESEADPGVDPPVPAATLPDAEDDPDARGSTYPAINSKVYPVSPSRSVALVV